MEQRFFTRQQFNDNFGKEMVSANDVYERRRAGGMEDYAFATYDFDFISDSRSKLDALAAFLSDKYKYQINEVAKSKGGWVLRGDATPFPVDNDNLMFWALGLYCKGYKFDCKLSGYGALADASRQEFPDLDPGLEDHYFESAMEAYQHENLGLAIIHFSTVIKINPRDPNAWYSRAIAKEELYTWKAARRDYDKAIELAPDFTEAIINRAANKDEAGEFNAAIEDYSRAIELEPQNAMAYFNRGNSKFNSKDNAGACLDWHKSKQLGAGYAQERIDKHCK